MKNLSTDSKIEFFKLNDFDIYTSPEHKNIITNLVINFNKKSNKYIGRNKIFIYNNLVIRKYYHGGLLRKILNDNFTTFKRFLNEFKIQLYLNKINFPTVKAIGILVEKKIFYKGYFITENFENSIDFITYLKNYPKEDYVKIFFEMGKLSNLLHKLDIIHNDLHLKNFLVKNNRTFLIDFDKSFFSEKEDDKLNDLKRFIRSCYKFNYLIEKKIEKSHIHSFLKGYGIKSDLIEKVNISLLNKISWHLNKPKFL